MNTPLRASAAVASGLSGALLLLVSMSACSSRGASDVRPLHAAAAHFDSVARASSRVAPSDTTIVALGYIERVRVGMGSPFRLAHQAMMDPRLGDSSGSRVAMALLGRLDRGDAYVVDPLVLDGVGPWSDSSVASGEQHLALIERELARDRDPRVGELSLRLAYDLASAEGTVRNGGAHVAAQVAALLRDRVLAGRDLHRLLRRAHTEQTDVLTVLASARAARALEVEQPAIAPLSPAQETQAIRRVPELLAEIRELPWRDAETRSADASRPVLNARAAERLATLGTWLPPQTPITITMRSLRPSIVGGGDSGAHDRARFVDRSLNEERLVGEYVALRAKRDSAHREPALAIVAAAVSVRTYAQEEPWFPGRETPTATEVAAQFGLRSLQFDDDVPPAWRPYYARMLASSIADVQRVLPAFSLQGIAVRFGTHILPDTALAMHDPGSRTLRLSIFTSAGTLAHEFAHDLDWQTARELYARQGGYSTDRAIDDPNGALGSSIRGLAAARVGPTTAAGTRRERPTELFARDVDWFIAASLAREGRSNGYLTAVQDALFTGYTAASPRDMIAGAGLAIVDALSEMTYVPPETREAFLADWTDAASVNPYLLVRRVLDVSLPRRSRSSGFAARAARTLVENPSLCATSGETWNDAVHSRMELLELALDSRARGIVKRWAGWYAADVRPEWASSLLGVAPYSPDVGEQMIRRVRGALVRQLESGAEPGLLLMPALATFQSSPAECAAD